MLCLHTLEYLSQSLPPAQSNGGKKFPMFYTNKHQPSLMAKNLINQDQQTYMQCVTATQLFE